MSGSQLPLSLLSLLFYCVSRVLVILFMHSNVHFTLPAWMCEDTRGGVGVRALILGAA